MALNLAIDLTRYIALGKSLDLNCVVLICTIERYQNLSYKVIVRIRTLSIPPL